MKGDTMKKEKYIEERYSHKKGNEKEVIAYCVNLRLKDGTKHSKWFKLADYKNKREAFNAAIEHRDRILAMNRTYKRNDKESEAEFHEFKKRLDSNENFAKVSYTVEDLYALVPKYFQRRKNTYIKLDKEFAKYIKPVYGNSDIRDITALDIINSLKICAESCVQQCVSNVRSIWHRIYQVAQQLGIAVIDLSQSIDVPRSEHVTERALKDEKNISQEEFDNFIEFLLNSYGIYSEQWCYDRLMIAFMLKVMRITGIRSQEVRAIKRDAVEFSDIHYTDENTGRECVEKGAYLKIRQSAGSTAQDELTLRETKTRNAHRLIPLDHNGAMLFKEIFEASKHDPVFSKFDGTLFSSSEIADYVRRVRIAYNKSTGKNLDIYCGLMRKAYADDMYSAHVSPVVIKTLMGHANENVSANFYASSNKNERINANFHRKFFEEK